MDRDEAIDYLEEKGYLEDASKVVHRKFTKAEEQHIENVQQQGKIYGDPHIEL